MKKIVNTAFLYAILAMIGGVFYREFTKFNGFVGDTSLARVHLHLFVLGTLFFLILLLIAKQVPLLQHKNFNRFYLFYNIGLIYMTIMFVIRGIFDTLNTPLSSTSEAMISGVAGIGHIILGGSIIYFFLILKKQILLDNKD